MHELKIVIFVFFTCMLSKRIIIVMYIKKRSIFFLFKRVYANVKFYYANTYWFRKKNYIYQMCSELEDVPFLGIETFSLMFGFVSVQYCI